VFRVHRHQPASRNDRLLLVGVVAQIFSDLRGVVFRSSVLIQVSQHIFDRLLVCRLRLLRQFFCRLVVALDCLRQGLLS
jgi:hypothetical protein